MKHTVLRTNSPGFYDFTLSAHCGESSFLFSNVAIRRGKGETNPSVVEINPSVGEIIIPFLFQSTIPPYISKPMKVNTTTSCFV